MEVIASEVVDITQLRHREQLKTTSAILLFFLFTNATVRPHSSTFVGRKPDFPSPSQPHKSTFALPKSSVGKRGCTKVTQDL